jgi:hypothetical protein
MFQMATSLDEFAISVFIIAAISLVTGAAHRQGLSRAFVYWFF